MNTIGNSTTGIGSSTVTSITGIIAIWSIAFTLRPLLNFAIDYHSYILSGRTPDGPIPKRKAQVMFLMETLPRRDVELLCDKSKMSDLAAKRFRSQGHRGFGSQNHSSGGDESHQHHGYHRSILNVHISCEDALAGPSLTLVLSHYVMCTLSWAVGNIRKTVVLHRSRGPQSGQSVVAVHIRSLEPSPEMPLEPGNVICTLPQRNELIEFF